MPEEFFEKFIKDSMKNACRSENLWGFTIWCSHEYEQKYAAVDSYETRFGILTKDNELKHLGQCYKSAIEEIKRGDITPALKTGKAIIIDENKPFKGWEYGEAFASYVKRGEHLKFVLSSKADDKNLLAKRGITELIKL